ncbi:hypothetical protein D3C84_807170 [compost metagenome]
MEIEEPFADKIADRRHAQLFGAEHGDPLGVAALDHILDPVRVPQVRSLQAQQAHIARIIQRGTEQTAVHIPARAAQAWQQTVAVIAGVNDEQTA